MPIQTKIVKITSNTETELLHAENELIIKNLSIVYLNENGSKTISLYLRETSNSSIRGALLYKVSIDKNGLYTGNIYMATNNLLTIETLDLNENDEIDVIIQYVQF